MTSFKRVATAAAGATFLLVSIGGLVRATKSGLGCGTDWPHCSGRLLPALANRAMVIEYSHRAVAGVVLILLGVLAYLAYRQGQPQRIKKAALWAFGLVIFQALLGMVVVVLELQAVSVVLHLGTAMALLALLLYIALTSDEPVSATDPAIGQRATRAAAGVFILLLVGSYMSGADAGYVFPDWPLMDGRLVPDLAVEAKALHFLHRVLAAVVGIIVLHTALSTSRSEQKSRASVGLAHSALALFFIEVLIGAANVVTGGNDAFVTLHLAVGAAIWSALVSLAVVTRAGQHEAAIEPKRSAEPVMEGG
jgi:cytochrome c oxidase assembly protein subunit 15